jgi:putative methionine-R-sulfoxide reductase with GAF domain
VSANAAAIRPWSAIEHDVRSALAGASDRASRMRAFVAAAWPHLSPTGVSWIGFYERDPSDASQLLLAAREPKPACSPIGLHGACGQCLLAAAPLVVRDVAELGAGYIACDPRDRSEVVVPCLQPSGQAWGVLDVDSHDLASFSPHDAQQLAALLRLAGLSA